MLSVKVVRLRPVAKQTELKYLLRSQNAVTLLKILQTG